jgi:hypothetical protein
MGDATGSTGRGRGPWFWLHPILALGVSVGLFGGVLLLRWLVAGVEDSISMLYVLPVALLALTFGLRVGLAAGLVAVGLLVAWVAWSGEQLSPLGWLSRVTPLLLLGGLVGVAAERIRDADRIERHAAEIELLQRDAAEINDSLIQGMAVTKWLFESGQASAGIELLEETMVTGQQLVGRMLGSDSVLPGDLRRSRPGARRSSQ